jgi:hypothetical protein
MCGGSIYCFVNFHEDKFGRVVVLLDDIKARNAWFLYAVAGILDACLFKYLHKFGFDLYVNKDDLHICSYVTLPKGHRFGTV